MLAKVGDFAETKRHRHCIRPFWRVREERGWGIRLGLEEVESTLSAT